MQRKDAVDAVDGHAGVFYVEGARLGAALAFGARLLPSTLRRGSRLLRRHLIRTAEAFRSWCGSHRRRRRMSRRL